MIQLLDSRKKLIEGIEIPKAKVEAEGGCGVLGLAANIKIKGKHLITPATQMHNRGNGKGGGIAAVGLVPKEMGVDEKILQEDYLLQVAFLDPTLQKEVEAALIFPHLVVHESYPLRSYKNWQDLPSLEVEPPKVVRYFVRVKEEILAKFIKENGLKELSYEHTEDEFIYQNSFRLNQKFYSSLGEKRAFVLSCGKNMLVLKIVGFAEDVLHYYLMEDTSANLWIIHQRYPTKGRVWHPGGAHPFTGLMEALVHNGDFANYYAITAYLKARNIVPLFLTDTEVSVLLFDLLTRIYDYPLEYTIEALAPTTERDYFYIPEEKRKIYKAIQETHLHASPDGPWFFIIVRNDHHKGVMQLLGITDTSMLRPQVFALYEGEISLGVIASERQAIDAVFSSLHQEDKRIPCFADRYWVARGGSHTDGGAFVFTLNKEGQLITTNKFGERVEIPKKLTPHNPLVKSIPKDISPHVDDFKARLKKISYAEFCGFLSELEQWAKKGGHQMETALKFLTHIFDHPVNLGEKKRSWILTYLNKTINKILKSHPNFIDWNTRDRLNSLPVDGILVIEGERFPPEGRECLSLFIVEAYKLGFKNFILFNLRGPRFIGCGLGAKSLGVRIDVYGASGDYLASGLDGAEVIVHGTAQDQVAQIMKAGKLVIYGDVGQTFMYGAKGGEVYVLGSAAGRPLINAVGCPRVVINGTCLDYLAESFMAGDPLKGGGFVILNGVTFDDQGNLVDLPEVYPGGNLFSLASGGAIYLRDPYRKLEDGQLNGGRFVSLKEEDWELIKPYLLENEKIFGITVNELLTASGVLKSPFEVFRKVEAVPLAVLGVTYQGG